MITNSDKNEVTDLGCMELIHFNKAKIQFARTGHCSKLRMYYFYLQMSFHSLLKSKLTFWVWVTWNGGCSLITHLMMYGRSSINAILIQEERRWKRTVIPIGRLLKWTLHRTQMSLLLNGLTETLTTWQCKQALAHSTFCRTWRLWSPLLRLSLQTGQLSQLKLPRKLNWLRCLTVMMSQLLNCLIARWMSVIVSLLLTWLIWSIARMALVMMSHIHLMLKSSWAKGCHLLVKWLNN